MCTKDRQDSLVETMRSLAEQRWDGTWEVLVVDNASSDGMSEAVRKLAADLPAPVRLVCEPEPGLSGARNLALRAGTRRRPEAGPSVEARP